VTERRSRGDGGLHWDENRQRWIATITIGFGGRGKRITRKRSSKIKTEAKDMLKELIRDYDDGLPIGPQNYTVGDAVTYWLTYGLSGRSTATVANYRGMAETHVIPALAARKLRELSTEDVDRWLKAKSKTPSTRSLRLIHALLSRAAKCAHARDKVKRNVVALADVPTGQDGAAVKNRSPWSRPRLFSSQPRTHGCTRTSCSRCSSAPVPRNCERLKRPWTSRAEKIHTPSSQDDNRHAPANTPGIRHVAFAVEDIDAVVADLRARGVELVGELERYEDSYRLCYVRGPGGIIVELAEQIN